MFVYNLSMPCRYRHEIDDDDQIKYGGECCGTELLDQACLY